VVYPESANVFFLEGYDVQLQFPNDSSLVVVENAKQVLRVTRVSSPLERDMQAIASDSTEGRFTSSPGYLKAANYVAGQLREAGLQTNLEAVPLLWDNYDGSSITIDGVSYPHRGGQFVVLQPGAPAPVQWLVLKTLPD